MSARPFAERALIILGLCGATAGGCSDTSGEESADVFLVLALREDLRLDAVDQLDLALSGAAADLVERTDPSFIGDLEWQLGQGPRGDQYTLSMPSEWLAQRAVRAGDRTVELDIPFRDAPQEGHLSAEVSAWWIDSEGQRQLVAAGAQSVELPLPGPFFQVILRVTCRPEWKETCTTGCASGSAPCGAQGQACGAAASCRDGCCQQAE